MTKMAVVLEDSENISTITWHLDTELIEHAASKPCQHLNGKNQNMKEQVWDSDRQQSRDEKKKTSKMLLVLISASSWEEQYRRRLCAEKYSMLFIMINTYFQSCDFSLSWKLSMQNRTCKTVPCECHRVLSCMNFIFRTWI